MTVEFLVDIQHVHAIKNVIKGSEEVIICTAFLHPKGLEVVRDGLQEATKRKATIRIYVGLSDCFTHPKALTDLYNLLQPSGQLFLCDPPNIFHPKIYCGVSTQKYKMVIGSANLTGAGLNKNKEASILHRGIITAPEFVKLETYIRGIEEATWTKRASLLRISKYKLRYDIRRRADRERDKQVEKDEKTIIAGIVINDERLRAYLRRYRAAVDEAGARGWTAREGHYQIARRILRHMLRARYQSPEAFLEDYEDLVGKKGQRGLWHSGGLFRKKNEISKRYGRVAELIRFAVANHTGRIDEVFERMTERAERIPGLGPNVVTEILNTLDPSRYPVLNANPVESLDKLGVRDFPGPQSFDGNTYARYAAVLEELATDCGFKNLAQVDHFLNYIYHRILRG